MQRAITHHFKSYYKPYFKICWLIVRLLICLQICSYDIPLGSLLNLKYSNLYKKCKHSTFNIIKRTIGCPFKGCVVYVYTRHFVTYHFFTKMSEIVNLLKTMYSTIHLILVLRCLIVQILNNKFTWNPYVRFNGDYYLCFDFYLISLVCL